MRRSNRTLTKFLITGAAATPKVAANRNVKWKMGQTTFYIHPGMKYAPDDPLTAVIAVDPKF